MNLAESIFLFSALILFYTYVGYGVILYLLTFRKKRDTHASDGHDLPKVTHIVTAYNEEECIGEKIRNCLMLDYPVDKIQTIVISDGSDDDTWSIVKANPRVVSMHIPERAGKLAAMKRAIAEVKTGITFFSDANAMLDERAVLKMVRHFEDDRVGAVAGEKRVVSRNGQAASKGEGIYWKYESFLKRLDSDFHTVVGAAGELFAIRTDLFEVPDKPCIIEDFVLTVGVAAKGHRVAYEPEAVASEYGSASVFDELQRKIRISAGGLQASWRLRNVHNLFRHGKLAFQLFSHRTLRWTLAPLALVSLLVSSMVLARGGSLLFEVVTLLQLAFYTYASLGFYLEKSRRKIKYGLTIFYFAFMNLSVFLGLFFLISGKEMTVWNKVKRA